MAINAGKAEVTVVGKFKDEISSKSKKAFDKLKAGAKAAFAVATVAVAAFTAGMLKAVRAANEQELAIAKLEGALRATGKFSKELSLEMQAMASSFQKASTTGDETILSLQSLLFAMGATTENIQQVTQATLDLSAGMGVDARGAALLFGKALSGDFGTLSRYGILVGDIEGDAEKLAGALAQVQQKFGGQAQAQANTFGGKMKQVANAFGDVLEEIGFVITKDKEMVDVLKDLVHWFNELGAKIRENRNFLRSLAKSVFSDMEKIWKPFGFVILSIVNGFRAIGAAGVALRGQIAEWNGNIAESNKLFAQAGELLKDIEKSLQPAAEVAMDLSKSFQEVTEKTIPMNEALKVTGKNANAHVYAWEKWNRLADERLAKLGTELEFAEKMKELRLQGLDVEADRLELIKQAEEVGGRKLRKEELENMDIFLAKRKELNEQIEQSNRITEFGNRVYDNFRDGMVRVLQDGTDAWEAFKNVALAALFDIQSEMLKVAFFDPIKKAAGGFISNVIGSTIGGFFASGGQASAGQPIVVGERGPEVFTPVTAGKVTPNNEIGGGGVSITQNISVGVAQTVRTEMMAMMPIFIDQAMNVISEERQRSVAFSAKMGV